MVLLKLYIRNFRCYRNYEVDYTQHIRQLSGRSGSGKTTIFMAIEWCLYGDIFKTTPHGLKSCKTEVSLTFGGLYNRPFTITRTRPPKKIVITFESVLEKTLQGDEAEAFIRDHVASRRIWRLATCSPQLTLHPFLTSNAAEMAANLDALAKVDDCAETIDKIKSELVIAEKKLLVSNTSLRGRSCDHSTCPETHKVDLAGISSQLTSVQRELISLGNAQMRAELQSRIDRLPARNKQELLEELAIAKQSRDATEERISLMRQLAPLKLPSTLTISECDTLLRQIASRRAEMTKCPVAYNPDTIAKTLSELKARQVANREYVRVSEMRNKLESQIASITLPEVWPNGDAETAELHDIEHRLAAPCGTPCPKCNTVLSYSSGKLSEGAISKEEVASLTARKTELRAQLATIRKYDDLNGKLQEYKRELSILPNPEAVAWSDEDVKTLYALSSVKYVEEVSHDEDDLREHKRQLQLRSRLTTFRDDVREVAVVQAELDEEEERLTLLKNLAKIPNSQYKNDLEATREELLASQASLTAELETGKALKTLYDAHRDCEEIRRLLAEVKVCTHHIKLLEAARDTCTQVRAAMVASMMDCINAELNKVGQAFFDKDLRLELQNIQTGKKDKKDQGDKTQGDLRVVPYLEDEALDISSLSGGERVRASLALYLACHTATTSRILLLDEPLHSVESEWVGEIMEYIRDNYGDGLCLIASHMDIGAHIDNVLLVNST